MTSFSEARRIVYDRYAPDATRKGQRFGVLPDGLEDDVAWGVDAGVIDPEDEHPITDVLYLVDKLSGQLQLLPFQPDGLARVNLMDPVVDTVAAARPGP